MAVLAAKKIKNCVSVQLKCALDQTMTDELIFVLEVIPRQSRRPNSTVGSVQIFILTQTCAEFYYLSVIVFGCSCWNMCRLTSWINVNLSFKYQEWSERCNLSILRLCFWWIICLTTSNLLTDLSLFFYFNCLIVQGESLIVILEWLLILLWSSCRDRSTQKSYILLLQTACILMHLTRGYKLEEKSKMFWRNYADLFSEEKVK